MNTKLFNVLRNGMVLCAIVLGIAAASVQAQTLTYPFRVDIPFDFSVGDKKLPSGRYAIGRATRADDAVVSVADDRGHPKAIRTAMPVLTLNAKNKATLVFHRYGDQYFLYQVWPATGTTGRQFPASRLEREIRRSVAADAASGKVGKNIQVQTVMIDGVSQ